MANTIIMPKLGFDMAEGLLVRWVKTQGEPVTKGEVLAEIETDKATVEVVSEFSGVVAKELVEEGASVPVGTPIAVIAAPSESIEAALPVSPPVIASAAVENSQRKASAPAESAALHPAGAELPVGRVKASPLARKLALDHSLDLRTINGSGPNGRIIRRDIEAALSAPTRPPSVIAGEPVSPPAPAWTPLNEVPSDRRFPMDRLRSAIARRMSESNLQVPHFFVTRDIDAAPMMELRNQLNALLPEEEKISVNDFVLKAAALSLRQFPNLNASLIGNEIIQHGQVNVGAAVSVPGGLLTVTVRDTDQKTLHQISREMKDLSARVRGGKVRPEDIEGSTFSVSNLGMYGVEEFSAIINPPEVAILAVGAVRSAAVVADGEIRPGLRIKMTLSADHRVTDGAEAAQFIAVLAEILEHPLKLVI